MTITPWFETPAHGLEGAPAGGPVRAPRVGVPGLHPALEA